MPVPDELRAEHGLIERVSERFLSYAEGTAGPSSARGGAASLRVSRVYANHVHHTCDEDVLAAAVKERASP